MLKAGFDGLLGELYGRLAVTREFQVKVAENLLAGRNVLLTAPTGSGKTWAALLPFIYAWRQGKPLADRLIYALPLRSLAFGLYQSTEEALRKAGMLFTGGQSEGITLTLQTGDHRGDDQFRGDLIFTTIDQLLAAYLNLSLSLSPGQANVNAGALVGSLVVLDEIHLLEPGKALATVIEMSRRLRGYTTFLYMTATLTAAAMNILAQELDAQLIGVEPAELLTLASHANKKKTYKRVHEPLSAERVLAAHRGGRSIVVCNSVGKAQQVYRELTSLALAKELRTQVILLHSRYYPQDRKEKESQLPGLFGPQANAADCILVATQVIEAGLDISCADLHTEVCPANALVQRAGRCARYAGEEGTVWIYDLERNENGRPKLGPYRTKPSSDLVLSTWETLASYEGYPLSFPEEQRLVDEVHEQVESAILREIIADLPNHARRVEAALRTGDPAFREELIRDTDSVSLIVHGNPGSLDLNRPRQYLSVPRSSLWALKEFFSGVSAGEWVARVPVLEESDEEGNVEWQTVASIEELVWRGWLICLNPRYASYDRELGLALGREGKDTEPPPSPGRQVATYDLECESYRQHVSRSVMVCRAILNRSQKGLAALSTALAIKSTTLQELFLLTAALHDTGKLSARWQQAVLAWQRYREPEHRLLRSDEPLAHSTYTPATDRAVAWRKEFQRGNHAVEGAFAVANEVQEWCGRNVPDEVCEGIAATIVTAIARHHAPRASRLSEFRLIEGALAHVNAALKACNLAEIGELLDQPTLAERNDFAGQFLNPASEDKRLLPLYWFLVRTIRLADQDATAQAKGGE